MGYYTSFNLDVEVGNNMAITIIAAFRNENEDAAGAFDNYGQNRQEIKWYSSTGDVEDFSKKYPDALFILTGKGEDGDHWRLYAKDGKSQFGRGTIVYPEFDESKLS